MEFIENNTFFNYRFENCLMKLDTFSQRMYNCITNQDPLFVDIYEYDYRIDSLLSPANNNGTPSAVPLGTFSGPNTDPLGVVRSTNEPAIGAYAIPN